MTTMTDSHPIDDARPSRLARFLHLLTLTSCYLRPGMPIDQLPSVRADDRPAGGIRADRRA